MRHRKKLAFGNVVLLLAAGCSCSLSKTAKEAESRAVDVYRAVHRHLSPAGLRPGAR